MATTSGAGSSQYPLTPLQEGMLLHSVSEPGVGMYLNQVVYNMKDVDVDAMAEAWRILLQRHEILRSSFHWEDTSTPYQRVEKDVEVPIRLEDWTHINGVDRQNKLRELLSKDKVQGFDFTKAPLLRLTLARASEKDWLYIFSHHHLLLDGWSKNQINSELKTLYDNARRGKSIDLPKPTQFREYVHYLQQRDAEQDKIFWRKYLDGASILNRLPGERLGTLRKGYRVSFDEWNLEIDRSVKEKLLAVARECKVTLNSFVVGVWAILLAKYSGQDDVVFGMLVSGRPTDIEGIDTMVGMFLNAIPVRIKIEPTRAFKEWILDVQRDQTSLKLQEQTPLRQIQEFCELPAGKPLYECIVVNTNTVTTTPANEYSTLKKQISSTTRAIASSVQQNVPLHLDLETIGDDLVFKMTYDTKRFSRESIARVMEHYRTLLGEVLNNVSQKIGDLNMMPPSEQVLVAEIWNDTDTPLPSDLNSLHEIFLASARIWPDNIAVIYQGQQITYRELEKKSRRVAFALIQSGFGGSVVGISIKRSIDAAIGILGILRAGCAYVPLDPSYPRERLDYMVKDSGVKTILVGGRTSNAVLGNAEVLGIDNMLDDSGADDIDIDKHITTLDSLAYILYTSGTTGSPKGIGIPHRVAVNRLSTEPIPVMEGERFCAKTSLSFVDSIWEMFSAWKYGCVLTIIPEEVVLDIERFISAIEESRATRIVLVPSLLRSILNSGLDLKGRLGSVDYWISSGEKLPEDLSCKFGEVFPGKTLVNIYGTSEVWDATFYAANARSLQLGGLPIGRPMGNVKCYIVDDEMKLVPIGIHGNLLIGGLGVPDGYWNREELTQDKFVSNPFGHGILYKTGDIARWRPDGVIELIGREDTQVKLRGFRIEIEEIENTLRKLDFVEDVVVWVRDGESISAGLICRNTPPDLNSIRTLASRLLPGFMMPTRWHLLKQIPKSPNGKIDRQRIEEFIAETIQDYSTKDHPGDTQTNLKYVDILLGVWGEILGLTLSGHDNVFHNGAHSLSATRAAIKIGKELGRKIPLKAIFENPTSFELAAWLERSENEAVRERELPEVRHHERQKEEPLSYNQKRLWFLDQLDPTSTAYTVPNTFDFDGDLNIRALEDSLKSIIARHESLRTTFTSKDGVPVQVIHQNSGFVLEFTDLSGNSGLKAMSKREEEVASFMRKPWSLSEGPLIRAKLIKYPDKKFTLLLSMHHIITDGHSMGIFAEELQSFYKAFSAGNEPHVPNVGLQYADYARWESEWVHGELFDKSLDYWRNRLADIVDVELPLDYARGSDPKRLVDTVEFELDNDLKDGLEKIGRDTDSTTFMVLLSGFQILLSLVAGQTDIYVGTPVSNRDRAELQRVIGFFVNTIILGARVDYSLSLKDAIIKTRDECLNAFSNTVPFDKLVDDLKPSRDTNKNPLFQVMYVHQMASKGIEFGNITTSHKSQKESSDFDLLLSTASTDKSIRCTLQYRTGLFKKDTIDAYAELLKSIYRNISQSSEKCLSDIEFVGKEERSKILAWGQAARTINETGLIYEWLTRAARLTPNAIAAEDPFKSITYSDLEAQSAQFANYILSQKNISKENVIGVFLEKSVDMLVALFGILKAGKAIMAIDPDYPNDRVATMLEETSCNTVVTQQSHRDRLAILRHKPNSLIIDNEEQWRAELPNVVEHEASDSDLAYISFTSGSTGKPKGVLVEHRNVVAMVEAQLKHFEITSGSRVMQVLSLSFDAGLAEIFRCIAAGACLVIADRRDILPGPGFIRILQDRQVSHAAIPPVMLGALPEGSSEQLSQLKTIITGGEACSPHIARLWAKNRTLIIGYGTTETANGTLFAKSWDLQKKPPLGKPLENACVYILNEKRKIVPIGIPGDIYIGGMGVSRGYLNRDELTKQVFVDDPFDIRQGARMYFTGDRGRWLTDGSVEYLGRKDSQVKIRGHRIELDEISETMQTHELIGQCIVIVSNESNVKRLFAYVTPIKNGQSLSNADLKQFAKDKLPEYMVPAAFMTLNKIPVTASGKVDYRSLPKPNLGLLADESAYIPPKSQNEIRLASIWCKVLGVDRVSIDANFFEYGGDSILSVQVVAQATSSGIPITVKDIFEHQTIRQLAHCAETSTLIKVDQSPVVGNVNLTPIQLWYLQQINKNPSRYNHSMVIPVPRAYLKGSIVEDAIRFVWGHHDALRSRFKVSHEGNWSQEILPTGDSPLITTHEISDLGSAQQSTFINKRIETASNEIDITSGPIARVEIFSRRAEQTSFIGLIIHHLITDIISWQIIIEDFQTCLRYLANKQEPVLPLKTTSYQDWANALVEFSGAEIIRSEVDFWLSSARLNIEELPIDSAVSDDIRIDSSTFVLELDIIKTKALMEAIYSIKDYTMQMVLLSAINLAFCKWSGNSRLLVDVEGHGREESYFDKVNLSRTVGWFTSFYPLLLTIDNLNNSAINCLEKTKEALNAIPNKGLGYGIIKYLSHDQEARRKISAMPQAQVAFNYIGINASKKQDLAPSPISKQKDLPIGQIKLIQDSTKKRLHDFEIIAGIANGQLSMRISFNKLRHNESTIIKISESVKKYLIDLTAELELSRPA